jgi:hypothetical protein
MNFSDRLYATSAFRVRFSKSLAKSAVTIKPRKGAFDNPTSRQKLKPFGLIGAFDDFDLKVRQDFGRSVLKDRARARRNMASAKAPRRSLISWLGGHSRRHFF